MASGTDHLGNGVWALCDPGGRAPSSRPVFLHTGWRTAGTWTWSRFRALRKVVAFYEPLHEVLAKGPAVVMNVRSDLWSSGHPELKDPYFREFIPLMDGRGAPSRHETDFELDRFDPAPDAAYPALKAYLDSLVSAAEKQGKTAVLKFCRSMGRLRWMIRAFPDAAHIVVIRNPAAQWASMWSQMSRHGNPWFVAAPYRVLGGNLDSSRVRRVMDALGCDTPGFHALASMKPEETGEPVRAMSLELSYRVFLAHWVLSALSISKEVSVIVDSDLMGLSPRYGELCGERIRNLTGLAPDFSNARPSRFSAKSRPAEMWMGLDARSVIGWHMAADDFVQSEIGADPAEGLALSVIRSKLAMGNQQAMLGGSAFQASSAEAADPIRYCVDPLSFLSLLQEKPGASVAESGIRARMAALTWRIGNGLFRRWQHPQPAARPVEQTGR
jgi:hypothetical protein